MLPGERYTFRVTATDHVSNAATTERVVALRQDKALYFLHPSLLRAGSDHLGSTSLTTDAAGNVVARRRYAPYGKERWAKGTLPTDYRYTGQRFEAGLGLYDPSLHSGQATTRGITIPRWDDLPNGSKRSGVVGSSARTRSCPTRAIRRA